MSSKVTLGMGSQFLTSYSALPKGIQAKVRHFVCQFRSNPKSASIHYESVSEFKDKKLRSVRIDQTYRGILLDTGSENTFILLWIDHHDEAYLWAKDKTFSIHPETGFIQFLELETVVESTIANTPGDSPAGFLQNIRDRELIRLGIPEVLIPYIRLIKNEHDLEAKMEKLSPEVAEILQFLAIGTSVEELERELTSASKALESVDTSDYKAALERDANSRSYALITDDAFLQNILDYPLDKWRVFLHPGQRSLVEKTFSGPARVLGGAGTGKTVVAMHRARFLARRLLEHSSDKRILFTTFSKNLAANIQENLRMICNDNELRKIEVKNLDAWAADFLHSRGITTTIIQEKKQREIWKNLADKNTWKKSLRFYQWEWEKIVQQNGIFSRKEYLRVQRRGAGTGLNRQERMEIWEIFEQYRQELESQGLIEYDDVIRSARQLLDNESSKGLYAHVIVDEAQDFSQNAFQLIARIASSTKSAPVSENNLKPDSLFIAGDSQQRIYGRKVVLKHCGISIQGRSRILKINYRTTEEISRLACQTLAGTDFDDLDGAALEKAPYVSLVHGENPVMLEASNFPGEIATIKNHIQSIQAVSTGSQGNHQNSNGEAGESPIKRSASICIVLRTNELLKHYRSGLEALGISTKAIVLDKDIRGEGILISTMHRVKGLEFDHVILAGASTNNLPNEWALKTAPTAQELKVLEQGERSLLYVVLSRARKSVAVSWYGKRSTLIPITTG